jgi:choline/glycine/proline betaine transport protein
MSWRQRLSGLIQPPQEETVREFLIDTVQPSMEKVATEFQSRGYEAEVRQEDDGISLVVPVEDARNFVYGVRMRTAPIPGFVLSDVGTRNAPQRQIWGAVTYFFDGRRGYSIMGYTRDQVITDILDQYEIYRQIARAPETELYFTSPDAEPETAK